MRYNLGNGGMGCHCPSGSRVHVDLREYFSEPAQGIWASTVPLQQVCTRAEYLPVWSIKALGAQHLLSPSRRNQTWMPHPHDSYPDHDWSCIQKNTKQAMAKSLYPIPARGFSPVMATIEHWSWSASNRPGLHWAGKEIANSPLCAQDPSGLWWDSMLQGQRWPHRPPGVRSTWHKLLPSTKHSPAKMGQILIPSGKGLLWNSNLFGSFAASHHFLDSAKKEEEVPENLFAPSVTEQLPLLSSVLST